MNSRTILVIHTALFFGFVSLSLTALFFSLVFPGVIPDAYVIGGGAFLFVLVLSSWRMWGGCPFTIWENRFREIERPGSGYVGACIDHYANKWFGIALPRGVSTHTLVALFLLPVVTALLR